VRSSDLVPVLAGLSGGRGMNFRQGSIVTWDPDTAENTVLVGETLLENLPILNTSEASLLQAGDVVGIMSSGSSWAIMGRLVIPGTPEAASSIKAITNRIQAASDVATGSRNSTAWGDLTGADAGPAVTIRIGASGRALCFWGAEIGQTGDWQSKITPHVGVQLSGANAVSPTDAFALNFAFQFPTAALDTDALISGWIQFSTFHLYTGLNPGLTTFTMKYRHDTNVPANAVNFNAREIAVFAL
jgi:hypothetical protein